MWEIWPNKLLPKALKSCPKSNKSPDLVTLLDIYLSNHALIPTSRRHSRHTLTTLLQSCFTVAVAFLFLSTSNNFIELKLYTQRDSNSDRQIRRRSRWPFDHRHGPSCNWFLIHSFDAPCKKWDWPMEKKSHAPLFTLFVYFTHLVPSTGLFWTIFFALPFKPI